MSGMKSAPYEQQLERAARFVASHDDFLVVSHVSPDGDAAGSTYAMGYMLHQLNKRFTMINEGRIPDKFSFLWGNDAIVNFSDEQPSCSFDAVIAVDCADFARIGSVKQLFSDNVQLLNIDHHRTNDGYGAEQLIKSDAAATAEILYDFAGELGIKMDRTLAECIYTGLLTDTGGFRYANTSPQVMNIAAELLRYDVNGAALAEQLLERVSFSHITLLQKALASLAFNADRTIGWIVVTTDDIATTGASNDDTDGLVNYPRNIEGVHVGMLFKEVEKGTFKVSLRSSGKVDVAKVAKSFGGGGHARAAGFTAAGAIDDAIRDVVDIIGKDLA